MRGERIRARPFLSGGGGTGVEPRLVGGCYTVAGHSREKKGARSDGRGRRKVRVLTCFPTWLELRYRGVNWSSDSMAAATPNLGGNGMKLRMRGEGRR